jgi:hypothetical protein
MLGGGATQPPASEVPTATRAGAEATATAVAFTPTPSVVHVMTPAYSAALKTVVDVVSEDTAPEKRAPYGDSYPINRLERSFLQDMTYVPDLDIAMYSVGEDADWWYVSIQMIGADPNNSLGIHFAVELDLDHDGFGDYIIWASPPYSEIWDTAHVQIFQDKNHDTGGLSGERSDAPLTTDGYESLIFNGGERDADPDMAWVRANASFDSTVQFAFKKSWAGTVFMLGVMADAGLTDVKKLDYVDRFKESEAGSPVRDKSSYPLKALCAVDNVCREAFGFGPTGYEPQLCPREAPATGQPKSTPSVCEAPPAGCPDGTHWSEVLCACVGVSCVSKGVQIDGPEGSIAIESLRVGDTVWTVDESGERIAAPILRVSRVPVPEGYEIVHLVLDDGRELWVSPGHPTADGRTIEDFVPGDLLDGARVTRADLIRYTESATYDILPSGGTGLYWANGILIGSTLADP